jgi:hypothetical protein
MSWSSRDAVNIRERSTWTDSVEGQRAGARRSPRVEIDRLERDEAWARNAFSRLSRRYLVEVNAETGRK